MRIFLIPLFQEVQFMPNPLSQDIRHRFQALHEEGHSAREIGRRLFVAAAVVGTTERIRRNTQRTYKIDGPAADTVVRVENTCENG